MCLQEFRDGIVNGAQWYPVYGGMQDWNYLAGKCMAITLELSQSKWRPEAHLPTLWEENREALLALPLAAGLGGELWDVLWHSVPNAVGAVLAWASRYAAGPAPGSAACGR
jgi:hypothetical protein